MKKPILFVHPLSVVLDGAPVIILNIPGIDGGHAFAFEAKMEGATAPEAWEMARNIADALKGGVELEEGL